MKASILFSLFLVVALVEFSYAGFSVSAKMREDFGDHKKYDLNFKNDGDKTICSVTFKMTFKPTQQIENKWNINDGPNANEYSLPHWVRIEPGKTYTSSGLVVNGPAPELASVDNFDC